MFNTNQSYKFKNDDAREEFSSRWGDNAEFAGFVGDEPFTVTSIKNNPNDDDGVFIYITNNKGVTGHSYISTDEYELFELFNRGWIKDKWYRCVDTVGLLKHSGQNRKFIEIIGSAPFKVYQTNPSTFDKDVFKTRSLIYKDNNHYKTMTLTLTPCELTFFKECSPAGVLADEVTVVEEMLPPEDGKISVAVIEGTLELKIDSEQSRLDAIKLLTSIKFKG